MWRVSIRALVVRSGKRIVWGVDGVSKMVIVGALSLIKILKKVLNTSMGLSFENERYRVKMPIQGQIAEKCALECLER